MNTRTVITATAGDIIAPTDMDALERRLMGAAVLTREEREEAITTTLEQSSQMLSLVKHATDPARFASSGKAAAEMAAHYAKRLDISKDLVLDAQVQQRQWERALGVAIREGQARGEILEKGQHVHPGGGSEEVGHLMTNSKPSPRDFAKKGELSGGRGGANIYTMTDGVPDDAFAEALETARIEGNVSRANVVRKVKEAKGEAPPAEPSRTGDRKRAEKQLKTLRSIANHLVGISYGYNGLADAGLDPAITNEEAREIIAGLDDFARVLGRIKKSLN